jgi:hypothetical protein
MEDGYKYTRRKPLEGIAAIEKYLHSFIVARQNTFEGPVSQRCHLMFYLKSTTATLLRHSSQHSNMFKSLVNTVMLNSPSTVKCGRKLV